MKLGFIAENNLAALEADARFAAENGFQGLEFNYWGPFDDLTPETVGRMRQILDRHGLACSSFGLWGRNHLSENPQERAAALECLGRAIEFATMLGASVLTTGGGTLSPDDQRANIEEFARVFPPFIEKASEAGMRFAIYPVHGGSFFRSIADYEAAWERGLEVGIKFDPANWHHAGLDYLAALRDHADKVAHVHIKEHLYLDGQVASQPAAGMGDIEWGKVMAFLYEAGYEGYLSFEPHGPKWSRPPLREKMLLLTKRHIAQFLV